MSKKVKGKSAQILLQERQLLKKMRGLITSESSMLVQSRKRVKPGQARRRRLRREKMKLDAKIGKAVVRDFSSLDAAGVNAITKAGSSAASSAVATIVSSSNFDTIVTSLKKLQALYQSTGNSALANAMQKEIDQIVANPSLAGNGNSSPSNSGSASVVENPNPAIPLSPIGSLPAVPNNTGSTQAIVQASSSGVSTSGNAEYNGWPIPLWTTDMVDSVAKSNPCKLYIQEGSGYLYTADQALAISLLNPNNDHYSSFGQSYILQQDVLGLYVIGKCLDPVSMVRSAVSGLMTYGT